MAKVARGRLSGRDGMERYTAEELRVWSNTYRAQAGMARGRADHPSWLLHWAEQIRCVSLQKEKAREHRASQRSRSALGPARRAPLRYSGFGVERIAGNAFWTSKGLHG